MTTRKASRYQHGLSILEVVVALAIIGVLTIAAWKLKSGVAVMEQDQVDSDLLLRADQAILAFATLQSRLPCPAEPGASVEDCSRHEGQLPWRTVGLPDASAASVRYAVGDGGRFQRLPTRIDVLRMSADKQPVAAAYDPASLGGKADLTMDFCGVLGTAVKGGVSLAYALQRAPGASGSAPPGNSSSELQRSVPSLWANLHCSDLIASAPRAHANAALAADMMRYAADEKAVLAGLDHDAAVAAFVFSILDAVAQTARAPYKFTTATMSCTNLISHFIDVAVGSADGGQLAALATSSMGCFNGMAAIGIHLALVSSYWVGVAAAIEKLAGLDAASLANRLAHADAVRELAAAVNARAQESVYRGLYLR